MLVPEEVWVAESLLPDWQMRFAVSAQDWALPLGGRLALFSSEWRQLSADPWILRAIQGYHLELHPQPTQNSVPSSRPLSASEQQAMSQEVQSLLEKEAVRSVDSWEPPGFASAVFVVPKAGGKMRPVVDLRILNSFLPYHHFKMEGIHSLRDLLQPGDYMTKIDLKDAYLTVPIAQDDRRFLQFLWQGTRYEFQCLPFGLSVAPWAFTKILHPVVTTLRQFGIRVIIYLDDMLILAASRKAALVYTASAIHLLCGLGFIVNFEKSVLVPAQEMTFLGFQVRSVSLTIQISDERRTKILRSCRDALAEPGISIRQLASIVGMMTSAWPGVAPAPLHLRALQAQKNSARRRNMSWETAITLNPDSRADLTWWVKYLDTWNGRPVRLDPPALIIASDAASHGGGGGWGAVCAGQATGGRWSMQEAKLHINALELLAGMFAVQCFARHAQKCHILLQMDNQTAVAYVNRMGGAHSQILNSVATDLWQWCLDRQITLRAEYIPGALNTIADFWSRHHSSSEWRLHPQVFSWIRGSLGGCCIDLFASRVNAQTPTFVSWHPDPKAMATDAFSLDWAGMSAYAFPPFSLVGRVIRQVQMQKVPQLVLVTPLWRGATWFPALLQVATSSPTLLPCWPNLVEGPLGEQHPLIVDSKLLLVAWTISRIPSRCQDFRIRCPTSCSPPGGRARHVTMTALGHAGVAGVVDGRWIRLDQL